MFLNRFFFTSKTDTKVPMMISYKKNTTMVKIYNFIRLWSFNISVTPSFSVVNAIWMENGGIYAVPNLKVVENMVKNGTMGTKQQRKMFLKIS